jgi:Mce-associated membrane protein
VEDQPADPGDLTTAAPVPQGKAARSRHRLPRQKLRQEGQDDATDSDAPNVAEAPTESHPEVNSEAGSTAAPEDEAPEDEAPDDEAPVAEAAEVDAQVSAPKRRRLSWRWTKSVEIADSVQEAPPSVEAPNTTAAVVESDAETETDSATTESDTESEIPESAGLVDEEASEPAAEQILVPHRTAGRGLKVAAVVAGALFVGATAFAGATIQPYLADRAAAHTKFEIAETAADAITTLWTYTPDDMDSLPDRAGRYLAGDFAVEYRRYIDAIVESNKQAQVSNSTQVLGAAVESLSPTEASALVYTNSVATSPRTKGIPSLRYLSYRLDMELRNRQWLITKMTAITSLDLTPRL